MQHDPTAARTAWSQKEADALIRFVQQLPPAPKVGFTIPDIFTLKCLCEEKREPMDFTSKTSASGVTFREAVCRQCPRRQQWDKLAIIICVACKAEVIRWQPHQDKSGFRYVAGRVYHTLECSNCNNKIDKSAIVEKTLWDRRRYESK